MTDVENSLKYFISSCLYSLRVGSNPDSNDFFTCAVASIFLSHCLVFYRILMIKYANKTSFLRSERASQTIGCASPKVLTARKMCPSVYRDKHRSELA